MPIKLLACDTYFSKCVREAANWTCARCGSKHEENSKGLHNAHFMSRGKWGTRFDPDNTAPLCYGCHSYIDREPYEKQRWFEEYLGKGLAEIVIEKSNRPAYGFKKKKREIAKHYREELKRLKQLRADGHTEKLKVIGY